MAPPLLYKTFTGGVKRDLFRSLLGTFQTGSVASDGVETNVAKDPSQVQTSIKVLADHSATYSDRAKAAQDIIQEADSLSAQTILGLWDSAHDLIGPSVPQNIRKVALDLLRTCIERLLPHMNEPLRLAFYYSIMDSWGVGCEKSRNVDSEVGKIILCLESLTCRGSELKTLVDAKLDVASLSDFFEATFSSIAADEQLKTINQITSKALHFARNCVQSGLELSDECVRQIVAIQSQCNDEGICIESIDIAKVLALSDYTEAGKSSQLALTLLVNSYIFNKATEDHAFKTLLDIMTNHESDTYVALYFNLGESCTTDMVLLAYISLLVRIVTESNIESLFSGTGIKLRDVGQLLQFLFCKQRLQEADNVKFGDFLVANLISLLDSYRFVESMMECPNFWLGSAEEEGVLTLATSCIQTDKRSDVRKNNANILCDRITNISKTVSFKRLGKSIQSLLAVLFQLTELLEPTSAQNLLRLVQNHIADISNRSKLLEEIHALFYLPSFPPNVRCEALETMEKILHHEFLCGVPCERTISHLLDQLFSTLGIESDNAVTEGLASFYYKVCQYLPLERTEELNSRHISPLFTDLSQRRRKSFISVSSGSAKTSGWSIFKLSLLATKIASLLVWSVDYGKPGHFVSFYLLLVKVARCAYQMDEADLFLISAKVLTNVHCGGYGQVLLQDTGEVVGITTALGRNVEISTPQDDWKWSFPEKNELSKSSGSYGPEQELLTPMLGDDSSVSSKTVDIRQWLSIAVEVIEKWYDWEIYSYLLTFLCPQFGNLISLTNLHSLAGRYRDLITRHMKQGLPSKLKLPKNLSTDELHIAYIRNLSPLLGYHTHTPREFADGIVDALLFELQTKEKTLIPSLHLLTICSQEISSSVKKFLTPILIQLQTRVTCTLSTPAILEFLLSLSDSPYIISHLTIDEFKRVFAIAFKLIESSRDLKLRAQTQNIIQQVSYLESEADTAPSTRAFAITEPIAHFFLTLSYKVISSWFLRMKPHNRMELAPFVVKSLLNNASTVESFDYDVHAHLDIIARLTTSYNDHSHSRTIHNDRLHADDDRYSFGRWVLPDKIISIETEIHTGDSTVTMRSYSGVEVLRLHLDHFEAPHYYDILDVEQEVKESGAIPCSKEHTYTASYTLMQLGSFDYQPLKVPDDVSIVRSLLLFDKLPTSEYHKIGLIYIAPHQTTETEVLSNTKSSHQYKVFLSRIGRFVKLQSSPNIYTGGLEPGVDGDYALVWSQEEIQAVFHVTTLMPNSTEDPQYSLKKRHVGNDFVSIFFDESGCAGFDFNVVKSQFNFINIVVKPFQQDGDFASSTHFKVRVYRKAGVPAFFSTSHFKILSGDNLAKYVRHVSFIADTFAKCWFSESAPDVCTVWARRAKQMTIVRDRVLKWHQENEKLGMPKDFTSYI